MNFKLIYSPNNLKPDKDKPSGKNGSTKSSGPSGVIADNVKALENHYMLQLHDLEERNAHLEDLVEQRTKTLIEVVETNAKFISILAHDLRSPFSSILAVLEILKESLINYDAYEIERYINMASNSANKTLSLIDNLLVWTISQNNQKSFSPVKIDLHNLLLDVIEEVKTAADLKQITLDHSVTPKMHVTADVQMVKTILRNLINNAIKYTYIGGKITISAAESDQFVEIAIEDNGIGISFEAQKDLFKMESFHSTVGTNNERGTGLGLLLCKEFIEIHGGKIWVESDSDSHGEGKGSEFKFTLPHYL